MATYLENRLAIRDNLAAELAGETARRAALVAAGHPPPATYSVGGKNVDWNGYMSMMQEQIDKAHAAAVAAGADGGVYEEPVRYYS